MSGLTFSFPIAHLAALDLCVDLSDSTIPHVDFHPGNGIATPCHVALPGMLKVNVTTFDGKRVLRLSVEPNTSSTAIEHSPSSFTSLSQASTFSLPISPVSLPVLDSQPDPEDIFSRSNNPMFASHSDPIIQPHTLAGDNSTNLELSNFLGNMASFTSFKHDLSERDDFREMSFRDSDMSLQSQPSPLFMPDPSPTLLVLDEDQAMEKIEPPKVSSPHDTNDIPGWLTGLGIETADCPPNSNHPMFLSQSSSSLSTESEIPRQDFCGSDFADNSTDSSGISHVSNRSRPSLSTKPYSRLKKTVHQNPELWTIECTQPGCGRRFRCQYTRDTHEKSHIPKQRKSFSCEYDGCDETFTRAHDRLRHEVAQHGKTCEYTCSKCSRFFSSEMMLSKHRCPHSR